MVAQPHVCNKQAEIDDIKHDVEILNVSMGLQRDFDLELSREVSEIKGSQAILLKLVWVILGILATLAGKILLLG